MTRGLLALEHYPQFKLMKHKLHVPDDVTKLFEFVNIFYDPNFIPSQPSIVFENKFSSAFSLIVHDIVFHISYPNI